MARKTAENTDKVVHLESHRLHRQGVLEGLFRENGMALRAYLLERLRDSAETEDLVQEVFYRLARIPNLEKKLKVSGKNRNFLITIANNLIVDRERKRSVRRNYQTLNADQAREQAYEPGPEIKVGKTQELELVKKAIMNLKPRWRKAFTMSRFGHKTYREISEEMGIGIKQVEKYIARSLEHIRRVTQRQQQKADAKRGISDE